MRKRANHRNDSAVPRRKQRPPALIVLLLTVLTAGGLFLTSCATVPRHSEQLDFIGNVWTYQVREDPDFLTYWNQVTPENAGKWGLVEWERDQMTWDELDVVYEFARENGIPFRFHALVWGRTQPAWLGRLSDDELLEEVEEWISLAGERYPATDFIDVVNEPLHIEPPYVWALGGPGETGFDWVIRSFELAREHFPNAKLGVNDFDILKDEFAVRAYLRLIELLKERELIDTVGVQAHGIEDVPTETIRSNLDLLAEAGLPIYVTELDLAIEDDARQAERMRELITLFWEHPAVYGVTLWGYKENSINSKRAYLLGDDGTERPALQWLREFRE